MRSLVVVFLLALAPTVQAGSISVTVPLTTAQDARLAKLLARINATNCASVGLLPTCSDADIKSQRPDLTVYPTLDAWASDVLKQTAKSALQNQDDAEASEVVQAFRALSPADQAAAKAALKLQ